MSTVIRIFKSEAMDAGIDIEQILLSFGISNPVITTEKAWLRIACVEDLKRKNIRQLKKDLRGAISPIRIEITDDEDIEIAKDRYKNAIDECSEYRIKTIGFEWPASSGRFFSLSDNAQRKWIGLDLSATKGAITFPYKVPTRDNDEIYGIADATEVSNMFLTAVGTVDAILSAGTAKKEEIDAETTKAGARQLAEDYLNGNGCSHLVNELGS